MRGFILALSTLLVFSACQSSLPMRKHAVTFSLDAEEAYLLPVGSSLGTYRLIIRGVSDRVFAFEGSPMQKLRTLTLGQFLLAWKSAKYGFKKVPPRAALIVYVPHRKGHMERIAVVLKLSRPEYDPHKSEVIFDAAPMHEPSSWMVGHPVQLSDLLIEAKLSEIPFENQKQ